MCRDEHKALKEAVSKLENHDLKSSLKGRDDQLANFKNQIKITKIVDNINPDDGSVSELKKKVDEHIAIDNVFTTLVEKSLSFPRTDQMEDLSIKIKIAEREYPMKVKRHEEGEVVAACKLINEMKRTAKDSSVLTINKTFWLWLRSTACAGAGLSDETTTIADQTVFEKVITNQLVSLAIL